MADENPSERPVNIQGTANNEANGSEATGIKIERVTGNVHVHGDTAAPPSFRSMVLVGVLAFLGAVLINIATSQLPPELQPYLWLSWPLALLVTGASIWVAYRQSRSRGSNILLGSTVEQRNRSRMLDKVESFWVKGVLEQSLYQIARIELDLEYDANKVSHPWDTIVKRPNRPDRKVPTGTQVIDLFKELGGEMLILGAPGAGKTTMLLELARDLIAEARQTDNLPIPVVFNLSTYASIGLSLKQWLTDELHLRYDVPRALAQEWIDAHIVLPLLDGLDEVGAFYRKGCVEAINSFRKEGGLVPLAVCSRLADYEALKSKLRLQGAILIEPLTRQQIEIYFKQVGRPLAAVRAALRDDDVLWELMDTPLILSIAALTYKDKSPSKLRPLGNLVERRRHLFDDYIAVMFDRRSNKTRYHQQPTKHWLSWMARKMINDNQTIYFVERMQPFWLPNRQRSNYIDITSLLDWLILALVGGLVFGSIGAFVFGFNFGWVSGLFFGLALKMVGTLDLESNMKIQASATLRWSWSKARESFTEGLRGFPGCGCFAIMMLIIGVLMTELSRGWTIAVISVLFWLLFVLFNTMLEGLVSEAFEITNFPNQGIRRSINNALSFSLGGGPIFGLLVGAALWLVFGPAVGLIGGLGCGLGVVLAGGLRVGGRIAIHHYTLRWLLYRNGSLPFRLVPFLDYCAERIFLRKVGGGYIFVHRLLMEHFASLHTEQPEGTKQV